MTPRVVILVSGALLIQAWLPAGEQIDEWKEMLRAVAVSAGCPVPVVAVRWAGGTEPVYIEVICRQEAKPGPPALPP